MSAATGSRVPPESSKHSRTVRPTVAPGLGLISTRRQPSDSATSGRGGDDCDDGDDGDVPLEDGIVLVVVTAE